MKTWVFNYQLWVPIPTLCSNMKGSASFHRTAKVLIVLNTSQHIPSFFLIKNFVKVQEDVVLYDMCFYICVSVSI